MQACFPTSRAAQFHLALAHSQVQSSSENRLRQSCSGKGTGSTRVTRCFRRCTVSDGLTTNESLPLAQKVRMQTDPAHVACRLCKTNLFEPSLEPTIRLRKHRVDPSGSAVYSATCPLRRAYNKDRQSTTYICGGNAMLLAAAATTLAQIHCFPASVSSSDLGQTAARADSNLFGGWR